jgi:hypothetical protein
LYDAIQKAACFWRLFYLLLIIDEFAFASPERQSTDTLQNLEFKLAGKLIRYEASIGGLNTGLKMRLYQGISR